MKKILFISVVLGLLSSCEEGNKAYSLEIESEAAQVDVPLALQRADIEAHLVLDSSENKLSVTLNGTPIPLQYDDWNEDGIWDEVFGLMDMVKGTNRLSIVPASEETTSEIPVRTNLHLGKVVIQDSIYEEVTSGNRVPGKETATTIARYQYEGPGWENDLIAFRTYFDERNGIDIFGKRTSDMVLNQVGVNDNYHSLADWGMDILKVGNSLGAGAIALSYQDSLYRVTDDSNSSIKYMIEGPLRSCLDLHFPSVEVGDTIVALTHRITIIAGMNGYQSKVTITPALPGLELATGIVNLETEEYFPIETEDYAGIATHGPQAFEGENLGMAVMAKTPSITGTFTSPEEGDGITQTFGITMKLDEEGSARFLFLAGWEGQNEGYREREVFEQVVKDEILKILN